MRKNEKIVSTCWLNFYPSMNGLVVTSLSGRSIKEREIFKIYSKWHFMEERKRRLQTISVRFFTLLHLENYSSQKPNAFQYFEKNIMTKYKKSGFKLQKKQSFSQKKWTTRKFLLLKVLATLFDYFGRSEMKLNRTYSLFFGLVNKYLEHGCSW